MSNLLIDHAINNIWYDTVIDSQYIFKPGRITDIDGVVGHFILMKNWMPLPTKREPYHVFQIGQLHPSIVGLFKSDANFNNWGWTPFSDSINLNNMVIDIYTDDGVHIPPHEVYYSFNNRKNFVIAVKSNSKIPINYRLTDISIRVFSNAYFTTLNPNLISPFIYTYGITNANSDDLNYITSLYNTYILLPGETLLYINGLLVDNISSNKLITGATITLLYDCSVVKVIEYPLNGCYNFLSEVDNEHKYLLNYTTDNNPTNIEHFQVNDLYLITRSNSQSVGVYFHRNKPDNIRMVTHRDFSVPVITTTNFYNSLKTFTNNVNLETSTVYFKLIIRHSIYNRPLINEINRINYLYKMSFINVIQTMNGVVQGPLNWRVEKLEAAKYPYLTQCGLSSVTEDSVKKAYGYYASSVILGKTPLPLETLSGLKQVDLPTGLWSNSTIYEYDNNGLLLGYYHNVNTSIYTATNSNAVLIEGIIGFGKVDPNSVTGVDSLSILTSCDHRVYFCELLPNNVPDYNWVDITNSDSYNKENNVLNWVNTEITNQYLMVRFNDTFLIDNFSILPTEGVLSFTLGVVETHFGITSTRALTLPYGQLDIFLNGYSLIEKSYLLWGEIQHYLMGKEI